MIYKHGFILKKLAKNDDQYLEKYNLNKLLDIYSKICEAVSYAHSQEIIHLDLKPDNIQVGEFGEVVICDWGLGKLISDKDETISESYETLLKTQTMTGAIKGTPGFMAPEQIKKGEIKEGCQSFIKGFGLSLVSGGTDAGAEKLLNAILNTLDFAPTNWASV